MMEAKHCLCKCHFGSLKLLSSTRQIWLASARMYRPKQTNTNGGHPHLLYNKYVTSQGMMNQAKFGVQYGTNYYSVFSQTRRPYSWYLQGQLPVGTKKDPPWRTLFFGSDEFAVHHLKALHENRIAGDKKVIDTLEVVIPKDVKCAVRTYVRQQGIPHVEWPIPTVHGRYDVGVVVSFGHLIPERIIGMFPYGILNVHPSLLPRWRGASPILHTILNGDSHTGISIMEIRPAHFDIGPLLLQTKYSVPPTCSAFQLRDFLASEGRVLLLDTLENLLTLERMEHEQSETGVTYAHKLNPHNARLNWEMQSVAEIDRQYRALHEIFQLRSEWKNNHIRLLEMVSLPEMFANGVTQSIETVFPEDKVCPLPGLPYYIKDKQLLCVRCKNGWVAFRKIVIKKKMTALEFYNGYLSKTKNKGIVFRSLPNELDKYTFRTSAAQVTLSASIGIH